MSLRACFVAAALSAAALSPCAADDAAWQESYCKGYANRTVGIQVRSAQQMHCGFVGARWEDNLDFHFKWCMGLNRDSAPAQAEAEIVARTQGLSACLAKNKAAEVGAFCDSYASKTVLQVQAAQNQSCGFSGPRWDYKRESHLNWCLGLNGDQNLPNSEIAARLQGMKDCVASAKAATSPPAQKIATAKNDVDIYDGPGGQFDIVQCQGSPCVMRKGNSAPVLAHHQDGWYKLRGISHKGGDGWVAEDHLTVTP